MKKDAKQKRSGSKKTKALTALMFLALVCPKAWGYAKGELPPSFSEEPFSSLDGSDLSETKFTNENFAFSRAILTNEKGVAICQVNLVENPEFLPDFAEPGSLDALDPLDLPECEEQSLDIVAQYAQQAWIKKETAGPTLILTAVTTSIALIGGCVGGFIIRGYEYEGDTGLPASIGGMSGVLLSVSSASIVKGFWRKLGSIGLHATAGTIGGVVCYGIPDRIFYE